MDIKAKNILKVIKNKYVVAGIVFLLWLLFFDQNNIVNRISDYQYLRKMKEQRDYYSKKIDNDAQRTIELMTDDDNLEKFAREQYLMKKPNEEVFVVIEK